MSSISNLLDKEIAALERQIQALRSARAALGSSAPAGKKPGRKPGYKMSAATRAKLRAAWKRRKAAAAKGN